MTTNIKNSLKLPRFIDVGVNLQDPVFRGIHRGSRKHPDDLGDVLKRSIAAGVRSMIITGGSLRESKQALTLAEDLGVFATAGCHPTRSSEFDKYKGGPTAYLDALDALIASKIEGKGRIVAIGECGLDYDRLHFANADTQQRHFRSQLSLAKKYHLPLFLHSRAAHKDFVRILTDEGFADDGGRNVGAKGGVVHSFTGTIQEMQELTAMGFHISINGCGMKTADNLKTAKAIPLERLLLETDAPWCSLTTTHASYSHLRSLPPSFSAAFSPVSYRPERFMPGQPVKGRNEPTSIGSIAWVLGQLHGNEDGTTTVFDDICEHAWTNTIELFGLDMLEMEGMGVQIPGEKDEGKKNFDIAKEEWPLL